MANIHPIWKDYYVKIQAGSNSPDFIYYMVSGNYGGTYYGKIYKYNGIYTIKMNEIWARMLRNQTTINFDTSYISTSTLGYVQRLIFYTSNDGKSYTQYDDVYVMNDWSYKEWGGNQYHNLSDRISDVMDPRQYFITTIFDDTDIKVYFDDIYVGIGTSLQNSAAWVLKKLNPSVKEFKAEYIEYEYVGQYDYETHIYKTETYKLENTCKNYCLYYLNARGGWDWLVIDGVSTKEYTYDRKNYQKNYNNTQREFGLTTYRNNIKETWSLNTGYLTDTQSEKMHNIFGSLSVYLHDLVNDTITPVVITDKKSTEKTFKNQNRRMYNYTINVESSQDKYRM